MLAASLGVVVDVNNSVNRPRIPPNLTEISFGVTFLTLATSNSVAERRSHGCFHLSKKSMHG